MTIKTMTVGDLRRSLEGVRDDELVVVAIAESTIGAQAIVGIEDAGSGFDFDDGRFILCPNTPVVRKSKRVKKAK